MTVHILTDSSHYLDPAVIAELSLHVLPLSLHLNHRDYRERDEITTEALFAMLSDKTSSWPTTAAVTPGALQAAFDALTAGGGEVVGIFMSRGTSITVENAQNAAAVHPAHDRIRVVDSLAVSGALALTLHTAGARTGFGAGADPAHPQPGSHRSRGAWARRCGSCSPWTRWTTSIAAAA